MIANKALLPPPLLLADSPLPSSPKSETARSGKFIPQEFRNKHLADSPLKQHPPKTHKKSLELLTTPFKKKFTLLDCKNSPESSSQKLIQESQREGRKPKHLENASSFPKLRETNSTMCQSPKAGSGAQYSRFSEFRVLRKLGTGRFGEVFLVKHLASGFVAAMKVINKESLSGATQEEREKSVGQLVSEIKIQFFLRHPNLIAIYDCFSDERNVYLLIELATDGHLFAFTSKGRAFSEEATSILVREIAEGVREMHRNSVIHRDIKLENIVLCLVQLRLFRAWPRSATSAGPPTVPRSSAPPSAALRSTCPRKCSSARPTTRRWTSGRSAPSRTNWPPPRTPSRSGTATTWRAS